jgi:hypothetical protein
VFYCVVVDMGFHGCKNSFKGMMPVIVFDVDGAGAEGDTGEGN